MFLKNLIKFSGVETVTSLIGKIVVFVLVLFFPLRSFCFEFPDSAVSTGMGGAYSVVGHENGLLRANPATIADTSPLYSIGLNYARSNSFFNSSYIEVSALDSTGSLTGGMLYGRFFNNGKGSEEVKTDDFYFALSEHYTDALYFGLGLRWARDFVRDSKGIDLTTGMMAKLGDYVRVGFTGYNLLKYSNPMFPRCYEFSMGFVLENLFRAEVDWLHEHETGWDNTKTLVRTGVEFLIAKMIGVTAGWQIHGYKYNTYSGGIFWRYPKGIVAYSFSSGQLEGEEHMITVELFLAQ